MIHNNYSLFLPDSRNLPFFNQLRPAATRRSALAKVAHSNSGISCYLGADFAAFCPPFGDLSVLFINEIEVMYLTPRG